jgi:hypothetical protein
LIITYSLYRHYKIIWNSLLSVTLASLSSFSFELHYLFLRLE